MLAGFAASLLWKGQSLLLLKVHQHMERDSSVLMEHLADCVTLASWSSVIYISIRLFSLQLL